MATKIVEVHPGIYEIFLPLPMRPTIINVYLLDCHGAWTLIDTGMNLPESIAALEAAMAEVGIKIEDLDAIIATHHHIDHFGASGEIRRRSHATTHIHRLEAERAGRMIEFGKMSPHDRPESRAFFARHGFPIEQFNPTGMRPAWMGTSMYTPVTQPDKYIDDHDVIKIGDRELEVIWTPGHSPGHNVIYPDAAGTNPLGDFIASQLKVQNFDVELVLPAHGGIYHDHRHRANQLIE